jgi:hypothetical protein
MRTSVVVDEGAPQGECRRGRNDAADAEAICEAVGRANIWLVAGENDSSGFASANSLCAEPRCPKKPREKSARL